MTTAQNLGVDTPMRTFDDAQRIARATHDGAMTIGPLETTGCAHGLAYQFRYEWPRGSGGPADGSILIVANLCVDCALQGWLRPGSKRKL